MSRWEGCLAAAPSLRSPGRAHLLTTRCARGGIPPSGRERALSEGATLPAGSGRLRPACVCCGTHISTGRACWAVSGVEHSAAAHASVVRKRRRAQPARNKTKEVTELGDLPHGIEDCQPGNGTLRRGGVRLHELQPDVNWYARCCLVGRRIKPAR